MFPSDPFLAFRRRSMKARLRDALAAGPALPSPSDSRSPVILIGMHRSGTSLMSRVLDGAGIHMGGDVSEENHESKFFMLSNEVLMSMVGATWDQPRAIVDFLADEATDGDSQVIDTLAHATDNWLTSRSAQPYWKGHAETGQRFGWKDPRTSLTWPVWHRRFPNAVWVVVQRDEADVVASLTKRTHQKHDDGLWFSWRTLDSARCSELHEEYLESIARLRATVPVSAIFSIRYEELVADPVAALRPLADGGICEASRLQAAAALVRRK